MTHVLNVIHYPMFGGPHNRNMRLVPVLAEKGIKTTGLLPDEPGNAADILREAGVDVFQMPLRRMRATRDLMTHFRFFNHMPAEVRELRRLIKRHIATHSQSPMVLKRFVCDLVMSMVRIAHTRRVL